MYFGNLGVAKINMKPQDILFLLLFIFLLLKRQPRNFVVAGLICLTLAIPLFQFWVFFTAERLVWYGAFFILFSILVLLFKEK